MGRTKLLGLTWLLALLAVAQTSLTGKEETTSFQGIAETREAIINSEKPVEIWKTHVVSGQVVKKGRLLVELERPELTMKINEISHQLEELKSQYLINKEQIRSEIHQRQAEQSALISEIEHKIEQIQSKYKFNKEMLSGLKSIPQNSKCSSMPGSISIAVANLKKERQLTAKRFRTEIDDLNGRLASSETPESIRQEQLKKELELLYEEKKALLILAPIDGLIGEVHCRAGEKISPFEPILTLHTRSPSYVRGYIHENIHNLASVGDSVSVTSVANEIRSVDANIVGVGSRIVEYPLRLKKRPEMQLWGREVEISLPENNPFLMGEKVIIQTEHHNGFSYLASIKQWLNLESYASESETSINGDEVMRTIITSESIDKSSPQIEASGLIYLDDLERFLVISDETRDKESLLYLMDGKAKITNELQIEGLDKIDDMEAICQDESGTIYIASSQARTKNKKLPDERKLFVQVHRSGTRLISDRSVLLYDLLKEAAKRDRGEKWATFIGSDDMGIDGNSIEIEGMFVYQNALFLGFKKPLKDKRAVILKIADFHSIFEKNRIDKGNIEIWQELDLRDDTDELSAGISDLCLYKNQLVILSSTGSKKAKFGKVGALTVFDFNSRKLIKKRYFNQLMPEGITFDSDLNCFVMTFDEGSQSPSKMVTLKSIF